MGMGGRLLAEGVAVARAYRASSMTITAVTAVMCLLVFLTAGQAAASAARILATIDEAGARVITVTAQQDSPGLEPAVVERIGALAGVEAVIGLGAPRDMHNTAVPGGANASARTVHGTLADRVTLISGRLPAPGEAVVDTSVQNQLGMDGPVGALTDGTVTVAVVGSVTEKQPITGLTDYVLVGGWTDAHGRPLQSTDETSDGDLVTLAFVLITDVNQVPTMVPVIRAVTGESDPARVSVQASPDLVEVQRVVSGDFGALSRQLGIVAVLAGLLVVSLSMVLSVTARRRDIGRRRALGATRSALLVLIIIQALLPATVGAALGTIGGGAAVLRLAHAPPTPQMLMAVPILAILAGVVGSIPAALLAALRDPVAVLRVA